MSEGKTFVVAPTAAMANILAAQEGIKITPLTDPKKAKGFTKADTVIIIKGDVGYDEKNNPYQRPMEYSPEQFWMIIDIMKQGGLGWVQVKWAVI